jgi:hypothetical protein
LPALLVAVQWAVATTSMASAIHDAESPPASRAPGLMPVQTGHALAQRALSRSSYWQAFQSRFGHWNAMWNEATGTPHRAFGPSIPLAGFANDAAGADHAVRGFIAEHPELFGGSSVELESVSSSLHGRVWYVRYRQLVHGHPVLFSDWEFRVGTNGRLMMFGADPRGVPADLATTPRLPASVARESAHLGLEFNQATDRVDLASELAYVPMVRPDGTPDLRLVYDATVRPARPGSGQRVLVDAVNGSSLWRQPLRAGRPARASAR